MVVRGGRRPPRHLCRARATGFAGARPRHPPVGVEASRRDGSDPALRLPRCV